MNKKRFIVILFACVLLLGLCTGCGKEKKIAEEHATEFSEAITTGDMKKVNQTVFGYDENAEKPEEGILQEIFKKDTVEVEKITGDEIIYKVEAPDLGSFFADAEKTERKITREFFNQYLENADTVNMTVKIPYSVDDEDHLKVNYQNEEFINAITGGLVNGYKEIYQEMLDQLRGEEEE